MPNLSQQIAQTGNCFRPAKSPKKVRGRIPAKGAHRVRIKPVSTRRAAQKARYNAMLPRWVARHPVCEVCPIINRNGFSVHCRILTDHPHHVKGRRGELLCDERWFLACCGGESHPQWIHQTHKADAIRLGLLIQT